MIKQKKNLSKPNTPHVLVEAHFFLAVFCLRFWGNLGVILNSFGADSGKSINKLSHNWKLKRKGGGVIKGT